MILHKYKHSQIIIYFQQVHHDSTFILPLYVCMGTVKTDALVKSLRNVETSMSDEFGVKRTLRGDTLADEGITTGGKNSTT